MVQFNPADHPHRRFNALTGEFVLVSPHRTKRPWQGKIDNPVPDDRPAYDPTCYLCPGNKRAGDAQNPPYEYTFVFTNDFAALLGESPEAPETHPLLKMESVEGECRVICFSPRHDLTLAQMEPAAIRKVIDLWAEQITELGAKYKWVQVFENKGALMGCSNPHPHGQIWASTQLPNEPFKEDRSQREYYQAHGRPLLLDYAELEAEKRERVVVENEDWLGVVPWWAIWPYEMLLMPRRRHIPRLPDLRDGERDSLSDILRRLLTRYDNLFETTFPYSMGWHGAPTGPAAEAGEHWQLHAHFYPPLLRSASIKKFLVGYEMLGEAQRDLTAEQAAERLRAMSETHFRAAAAVS